MATIPDTAYAKSGDIHIAYQVLGHGPFDLLFVHGWISHLEHLWEEPSIARFFRQLASFCRLIMFDKRGTGRVVLDAVGCERARRCNRFLARGEAAVAWD